MIFSPVDRDAIFRSQVRKACESTAMMGHHELSPNVCLMLQTHLLREVGRCSHMIRIADNDLTRIRQAAVELDVNPINLPPSIYRQYLAMMDDKTRENESYYMFLYAYMLGYLDHIRAGIDIADGIIAGGNPISYSEIITLTRVRGIYEKCSEHCREMGGNFDDEVPYSQALEYVECAMEEISIMLRIATGKEVEVSEISYHMEWAEALDSTPFRNLFMVDMDPEDLSLVEAFEVGWEERIDIMVG